MRSEQKSGEGQGKSNLNEEMQKWIVLNWGEGKKGSKEGDGERG